MLKKDSSKRSDVLCVILVIVGIVSMIAIAMSATAVGILIKFIVSLIVINIIGKHIEGTNVK